MKQKINIYSLLVLFFVSPLLKAQISWQLDGVEKNGDNFTKDASLSSGWNCKALSNQLISNLDQASLSFTFSSDPLPSQGAWFASLGFVPTGLSEMEYHSRDAFLGRIQINKSAADTYWMKIFKRQLNGSGGYDQVVVGSAYSISPGSTFQIITENSTCEIYVNGTHITGYDFSFDYDGEMRAGIVIRDPGFSFESVVPNWNAMEEFPENLTWSELTEMEEQSSDGRTLAPTGVAGSNWITYSAFSENSLAASQQRGKLAHIVPSQGYNYVLGLSEENGGINYTTIDYAIRIGGTNTFSIFENGTKVWPVGDPIYGDSYSVSAGDEISIRKNAAGFIEYYHKSKKLFTSGNSAAQTDLYIDLTVFNANAVLSDIYASFGNGGTPPDLELSGWSFNYNETSEADPTFRSGNVGIGVATPITEKLEVGGKIKSERLSLTFDEDEGKSALELFTSENIKILEMGNTNSNTTPVPRINFYAGSANHRIYANYNHLGIVSQNNLYFFKGNEVRASLKEDGQFQIGGAYNQTDYDVNDAKLLVYGKIGAANLRIDSETWGDYVFDKDYDLMTLKETESFIEENGHLPGVPSANEIKANGLDLQQILEAQMVKIEELTLQIIELEKKLEGRDQEEENE